jgi:hypothetical protein
MAGESKVIKDITEKVKNPTQAAKGTIDGLISNINKLDSNQKIPAEDREKIKKVSEDVGGIIKTINDVEEQRALWQSRYDTYLKIAAGYEALQKVYNISSSLNPVAAALALTQAILKDAANRTKAGIGDVIIALKNTPKKSKELLKTMMIKLDRTIRRKEIQEQEAHQRFLDDGFEDDLEIEPLEFDDVEI